MNNSTIFITGISSGIGEALQEILSKNNFVYGIGRSNPNKINSFINLDLKNKKSLQSFVFPKIKTKEVILINNAGIIGPIKPIFNQNNYDIEEVYQVNIVAPSILTQKCISQYKERKITIINISSGASKSTIPSWSTYCASKSALDSFTLVCQAECIEKKLNVKLYSISPGVVDTPMQEEIRSKKESEFSQVSNFIDLKKQNKLITPLKTAKTLIEVFSKNKNINTIFSLRDFY